MLSYIAGQPWYCERRVLAVGVVDEEESKVQYRAKFSYQLHPPCYLILSS